MARTMAQVLADEQAAIDKAGGPGASTTMAPSGFRPPLNANIQIPRTYATPAQIQQADQKLLHEEERALELALESVRRRRAAEGVQEPA